MTLDAFLAVLRDDVARHRFNKDAATAYGISHAYLSDVLTGKRKPGRSILDALGYERVEDYRPKDLTGPGDPDTLQDTHET